MAAAPKAYLIGGHGFEEEGFFRVPEGCTIVAKGIAGAPTTLGQTSVYNRLLCTIPEELLLYPSKHTIELIKNFGSVAVYEAGELCPKFSYELLDCFHTSEIDEGSLCDSYGSGVVDLQLKRASASCEASAFLPDYIKESDYISAWDDVPNRIVKLFSYSVYPTEAQIKERVDAINLEETALEDVLNSDDITVSVTQEELCTRFPGVYYNFVCRDRELYTRTHLDPEKVSRVPPKNFPLPAVRQIFMNRINEAERKRKGLLKDYYTSTPYKEERAKGYLNQRMERPRPHVLHPEEMGQTIWGAMRSYDEDTVLRDYIYRLSSSKNTVVRKRAILNYKSPGAVVNSQGTVLAAPGEGSILWLAIHKRMSKLIEPLIQLGARVDDLVLGKSLIQIADEVSPEMGRVIRKATKDKCFPYAVEESGLSCYGAAPPPGKQCCRTCEDVRAAYARMTGRGVLGTLKATLAAFGRQAWAFDPSKILQCRAPKGPNARWNKPWVPNTRRVARNSSKKRARGNNASPRRTKKERKSSQDNSVVPYMLPGITEPYVTTLPGFTPKPRGWW
jgi:hypothetical protein